MQPYIFFYLIVFFTNELLFAKTTESFLLGIECLTKKIVVDQAHVPHPRTGIVTNQTGRTMQGKMSVDIVQKKGINVTKIFAPEHGYSGTVLAGHDVKSVIDLVSGIPVISLYAHGAGKHLTAEQLQDIDILIFDMQDCGMRHYTYISTLYKVMEACKNFSKPLIVCDRPNPLGGRMEGPVVEPSLHSFISIAPIPLRHGMTLGELALYFNVRLMKGKVNLRIIPMQKYTRKKEEFVFLAPLSPNLSMREALYGYSFLGLIGEIKPFDVGVGTPFAFQRLGLPINTKHASLFFNHLENEFKKMHIQVKKIQYITQKNIKYTGLQFLFNDTISWSTIQLLAAILNAAKKSTIFLTFSAFFNKAFGTDRLQKAFQENKIDLHFVQSISKQTNQFYEQSKQFFLYKPYPYIEPLS